MKKMSMVIIRYQQFFYLNVLPKGGVRIIKNEWKTAIYCQRNLQRRCLFARGGLRDEKDEHGNYLISTAFFFFNVLPERSVQIIKNSCNKLSDYYLSSEQAQRIFCKNFFFFFGESSSRVFL